MILTKIYRDNDINELKKKNLRNVEGITVLAIRDTQLS
jgi:hypothetical protein